MWRQPTCNGSPRLVVFLTNVAYEAHTHVPPLQARASTCHLHLTTHLSAAPLIHRRCQASELLSLAGMFRHHTAGSAQSPRRRRPGQAIRRKLSPVMPDSAGDDSISRFADTTEVESYVEQSQAEEDEQGLARHGNNATRCQ